MKALARTGGKDRRLMSRPQPFGLLPTWWFWRELREERPLLGICIGTLVGLFVVVFNQCLIISGIYVPMAFILALCGPLIGLGMLERGLRHMVIRRRRRLARGLAPSNEEPRQAPTDRALTGANEANEGVRPSPDQGR